MPHPRILLVYKSGGGPISFGDRFRAESILAFLRKNQFRVIEAPLTSLTRWGFWRTVPSLFPLYGKIPAFSRRALLQWLDMSATINSLKMIIRKTKPDIVLAETSLVGWMAVHVCESFSIPCIIDCHGLAFAEARGMNYKHWQYLEYLEKEAFLKCDHLLVVSKRMKDYISQKYKVRSDKISVVPNGSSPQQFTANYRIPLRVIYAGIFSFWEKIDDFLDIAKQIANYSSHKFKFYLAGAGPLKDRLLKRIRTEKIPVTYLGYIPRQKIFSVLSRMQIGIAPSTRDLARVVASPIKIFDYMASGLPVIAPKIGDWGEIIVEEDCGIALEDDSIENYIEALNILAQKDVWTIKSNNAINAIKQKYNWNNVLKPLVDVISNLIR
jgi:glycosyltransferase involved in cell wall biosynthesis